VAEGLDCWSAKKVLWWSLARFECVDLRGEIEDTPKKYRRVAHSAPVTLLNLFLEYVIVALLSTGTVATLPQRGKRTDAMEENNHYPIPHPLRTTHAPPQHIGVYFTFARGAITKPQQEQ